MKRRIIVVALVILGLVSMGTWASATALAQATTQETPITEGFQPPVVRLPGDANGNGKVDIGDVVHCLLIISGDKPFSIYADTNRDGVVDMRDVVLDERLILGWRNGYSMPALWGDY